MWWQFVPPGAAWHTSCLDTVVGLKMVCGLMRGNKEGSFTDIRKMFGKIFKVLISSETLSTPTVPCVSPEMQLSCTSNSMLSWSSMNSVWADFCSSHDDICFSISLPIHVSMLFFAVTHHNVIQISSVQNCRLCFCCASWCLWHFPLVQVEGLKLLLTEGFLCFGT